MGVIKINGVTYGGGDNSVTLTQAQYDALVDAGTVDPHATYFITDRSGEGGQYAANVLYDNSNSGLSSNNVQNALDEIVDNIDNNISAASVGYSNTTSGLTADDVQEAIDEIAPVKSSIGNIDNVTLTTPAVGDTLVWNGSAWVNGKISTTAYATKNTTYVNSSNDNHMAYIICGHMVFVEYTFSTIAALSDRWSVLFSGLPKPILDCYVNHEGQTPVVLQSNGEFKNVYVVSATSAFFRGCFTYMTNDLS